jgi:tungstate transport system ATP-binding protein
MSLELRVANISKSYDGNRVLKDCSFSFHNRGIYVLTGPNGSGKSTFLRICALLEEPDKGEVGFLEDGIPLHENIQLQRRITLLLPKIGVFNTTVFKNVAYGLKIRGFRGSIIEDRVDKALDFVGLIHKKQQKALTLSSGETQRLGIARALVIEPEIFFLDEPTASVDKENTHIIEEIILKLKKKSSSTVIMTTHDTSQAERLADKFLKMQNGDLVEHIA